ncbi:hypothetical protein SBADM41S_04940 [Streptomyces badius]
MEGFLALREAVEDGDPEPLAGFHRAAASLVRPRTAQWRTRWENGAAMAAAATAHQLDALGRGEQGLAAARVHAERPSAHGRFGMCGRLERAPHLTLHAALPRHISPGDRRPTRPRC